MGSMGQGLAAGVYLAMLAMLFGFAMLKVVWMLFEDELERSELLFLLLADAGLVALTLMVPVLGIPLALTAIGLPYLISAMQNVGEKQAKTAHRDEKEQHLLEVVEENPGNGAAWSALGDLYSNSGRLTEAVEAYERSLGIYSYPQLQARLASVRRRLERPQSPARAEAVSREVRMSLETLFSRDVLLPALKPALLVIVLFFVFELLLQYAVPSPVHAGMRVISLLVLGIWYLSSRDFIPAFVSYVVLGCWGLTMLLFLVLRLFGFST